MSSIISSIWQKKCKYKTQIIFLILYLFATLFIIPFVAPIFGREKVQHSDKIQPSNYMTVILNRNYVRPPLNELLANTAQQLTDTDIEVRYLDANFPFLNTFPLLPHLSHSDGKKIDISLIYENADAMISHKQQSISGYGVFENPQSHEYNQSEHCLDQGYILYDYPKYLTLGTINDELVFSQQGTKVLIQAILTNQGLGKLFIEPHLKHRMNLHHNKIRFHGCRSVRHDDHIHIQLK